RCGLRGRARVGAGPARCCERTCMYVCYRPRRRKMDATGITWSREVSTELRALSGLEGAHYRDVFSGPVPDGVDRAAAEWAQLALDVTLGPVRGPVLAVQRFGLGLRLARKGRDPYLGWRVAAEGGDWIRLHAASWFLTAEMVFKVDSALWL